MKVATMEGALLDFWVARAAGKKPYYEFDHPEYLGWLVKGQFGDAIPTPRYSSDWSAGGVVIDLHITHLDYDPGRALEVRWRAVSDGPKRGSALHGPTPLVAAMRAYVASNFGLEFDA